MGFYSDARKEFFEIYGYYPKSNILNDFINDNVKFYLKEKDRFINDESNKDFIGYLRKKFYERYKFEPNDYDLFSYKLFRKGKNYIPSKIFLLVLMLFKDYHLTFSYFINNDSYYGDYSPYRYKYYYLLENVLTTKPSEEETYNRYCKFLYFTFSSEEKICRLMGDLIKDGIICIEVNLLDYIKNTIEKVNSLYNSNTYIYEEEFKKISTTGKLIKLEFLALFEKLTYSEKFKTELITSFETGNYINNISDWLFGLGSFGRLPNAIMAKSDAFDLIFKKIEVNKINLPLNKYKAIEFLFDNNLEKEISVVINTDFEEYRVSGNLKFVLESEEHYIENLGFIMKSNLFLDKINKFIEKYKFNPTIEHFIKYIENEKEFDALFSEVARFMKAGVIKNKDVILNFFKTDPRNSLPRSWYASESKLISYSETSCLNSFISAVCDKILYIPPKDSWETIYLDINFSCLTQIIVSKHFNKFEEKLYLGTLDRTSPKLIIEEPYATGEKVRALFGTRYYEEYRKEFLLTHTETEWKYLVAPECVKETLKFSPNANCHVIISVHDYGNNGISKTWWTDWYEAYEWNVELHYWEYVEEYEHGSD